MLSVLDRGLEPSDSLSDSIMYLTSVNYLQTITTDNTLVSVDKIKDLLTTRSNRARGLLLLKVALEQNSDVHLKGNWHIILFEILKETSDSSILKSQACNIFSMLMHFMSKDSNANIAVLKYFGGEILPFILQNIDLDVQWTKAALKCVHVCLKYFPSGLMYPHKEILTAILLRKISNCVSSEIMEVVADCFCEMPNVVRSLNPETYCQEWKMQYLRTLTTLEQISQTFGAYVFIGDSLSNYCLNFNVAAYEFEDAAKDVYQAYMQGARCYINLSKCLAKMLSTQSRFSVEFPLRVTLHATTGLFQDYKIVKPSVSVELQVICSVLSQMQLASLVILEALILNYNTIQFTSIIVACVQTALSCAKFPNVSVENISQVRHGVWKFLKIFIKKYGSKASGDILNLPNKVIRELLIDISIQDKKSETTAISMPKSKKNAPCTAKRWVVNQELREVCKEALATLEQLLYTGSPYFTQPLFQEVFNKVLQIAVAFRSPSDYPFPYDDELCRKNLYSTLLALAVTSKLDHSDMAQTAVGILKTANRDPSPEVTGFCNMAMSVLAAKMHPKQPPKSIRIPGDKTRQLKVSSAVIKCNEWGSDEFIPDIPVEHVPKSHERIITGVQSFHDPNESAMHEEETMEEDLEAEPQYVDMRYVQKYSEQSSESHQNGEDMLETQHSSECQDEVESDEEDEEEEEEDEERSSGEEEIQQIDIPSDNMYIPSTNKLQILSPAHISETVPQSVSEQEYELLRPCVKNEDNVGDNNKNMHLNGIRSIVPDADVASTSAQQSVANENGYDDEEELEEEEEAEDEEEDEESGSFPAEKRVPEFYEPSNPAKRQKLDIDEPKIEAEEEEQEKVDKIPKSPTLMEMKADFCVHEVDEVKS